jgi:hypothetical protein
MDDAASMGRRNAAGHLPDQIGDPAGRESLALFQSFGKRPARAVFEDEISAAEVLSAIVDLQNIGMPDGGDGLGFDLEPGQCAALSAGIAQHQLDRDRAVQSHLPRLVDDTHAAAIDLANELITGKLNDR